MNYKSNRKMKIAHVIWSFPVGGSESILVDVVNEQCKMHTVALVIVNSLINSQLLAKVSNSVRLITINRKPGSRNILDIIRLNIQLNKFQPNIVHCHNWSLVKILKLGRFKKVFTVHNTYENLDDQCLIKYDKVFAISDAVAKEIARRYKNITPVIVYNGIVFSQIYPREDYYYDTFRMVQVSRLDCNKKAQDVLLKALHLVVYQYGIRNVRLDFIGAGHSYDYLKTMTKELDLDSYSSFLGEQDRAFINTNLKNYNLLIQPSNFEGFGLTIVEGIAAKIPVLVSNIEGPMEIVQGGKFGYLFEVGNPKSCAEKIVNIMDEYGTEAFKENVNLAYEYAAANFNIKNTALNYISQYSNIIGIDS